MRIAASIDHPDVVAIHCAGEQAGFLFLAMDYVHGIDYDHSGHYDNALNRSELDSAVSQDATAPALCGTLLPASVGESV